MGMPLDREFDLNLRIRELEAENAALRQKAEVIGSLEAARADMSRRCNEAMAEVAALRQRAEAAEKQRDGLIHCHQEMLAAHQRIAEVQAVDEKYAEVNLSLTEENAALHQRVEAAEAALTSLRAASKEGKGYTQ